MLVAIDRNDERLAAPGDLELVRDFVNTLDILPGTERFGDPVSLALWLADRWLMPLSPNLTDRDLERAKKLREALRAFLLANAGLPLDPGAAMAFDDAAGPVRLRARADEEGWSCSRPKRKGWFMPSDAWSRSCSRRSKKGPGPASKSAPNAAGRSTITPRTTRPPGAAPSAARGCVPGVTASAATARPLRDCLYNQSYASGRRFFRAGNSSLKLSR